MLDRNSKQFINDKNDTYEFVKYVTLFACTIQNASDKENKTFDGVSSMG